MHVPLGAVTVPAVVAAVGPPEGIEGTAAPVVTANDMAVVIAPDAEEVAGAVALTVRASEDIEGGGALCPLLGTRRIRAALEGAHAVVSPLGT